MGKGTVSAVPFDLYLNATIYKVGKMNLSELHAFVISAELRYINTMLKLSKRKRFRHFLLPTVYLTAT